jgi:hypothetical protein
MIYAQQNLIAKFGESFENKINIRFSKFLKKVNE